MVIKRNSLDIADSEEAPPQETYRKLNESKTTEGNAVTQNNVEGDEEPKIGNESENVRDVEAVEAGADPNSENSDESESGKCCQRFRTAQFKVYVSHFLSSWGDRMWMFAGGLFLLEVTPGSLRLAAVYGAAIASTVILLGASVGRWVDRNNRLRTAQVSLSIQNIMVCFCAAILVVIITQRQIFSAWDGWSLILAETGVVLTACIAQIGTLGCKLAIEKDWILVICGKDKTRLAGMNSVLRTVDLSTEVLAPVIVGAVMTSFGMAVGGIVIAGWNVGSLVVEYGLLHHLYYSNADLRKAKVKNNEDDATGNDENATEIDGPDVRKRKKKKVVFVERLISAWTAWVAYMKHPVRDAGLGLALLFMTVLAFDNYSRAYVYESGVSETILGVLTAVASMFGIFGSLAFPILRRKLGFGKTGLIGFGVETLCLSLCVISVFAPGSPFEPSALLNSGVVMDEAPTTLPPSLISYNATSPISGQDNAFVLTVHNDTSNMTVTERIGVGKEVVTDENIDFTSVILLLCGIITSRFGLWVADLTVTQILQEGVEESHRGAINGVQSSLNQTLDLCRSLLIIILPKRETFGFLIILSFVFVSIGWIFFAVYVRRQSADSKSKEGTPEEQLKPVVT